MVSSTDRVRVPDPLSSLTSSSSASSGTGAVGKTFAQQLGTALEGVLKQTTGSGPIEVQVTEEAGQHSGGSQFLVTLTHGSTTSGSTTAPSTTSGSTSASSTVASSDIPTMLGMGPVAGTAPVKQGATAQAVVTAPMTEGDAYWAEQPAAVQALRNMPDGPAKNALALNLANQGYSIDTQIMVWGWDPQMTMTVRENNGYSWVPSYGQSNIAVGPGLSMPGDTSTYNPGNTPAGGIQVSTAFAVGTIQNPLVQSNASST